MPKEKEMDWHDSEECRSQPAQDTNTWKPEYYLNSFLRAQSFPKHVKVRQSSYLLPL